MSRSSFCEDLSGLLGVGHSTNYVGASDCQFTAFYKQHGRIPWGKIVEHPDYFIDKRSRPESDHALWEPSRMTEQGVNVWLKHWVTRQTKERRPLVLLDPSMEGRMKKLPKPRRTRKPQKPQWMNPDVDDDTDTDVIVDSDNDSGNDRASKQHPSRSRTSEPSGNDMGNHADTPSGPPAPASCVKSLETRRRFLASLSQDPNYIRLLRSLDTAKVFYKMIYGLCSELMIL